MAISPIFNLAVSGTNGQVKNLRFQGAEISGADFAAEAVLAAAALETIRTALNAITDGNIDSYSWSVPGTGATGGVPADADVFENAKLVLDITPSGEAAKQALSRVPAPSDGIFVGTTGPTKDVVDVSDADVAAYVAALAAHVLVSDGEAVVGIVSGIRDTSRIRS